MNPWRRYALMLASVFAAFMVCWLVPLGFLPFAWFFIAGCWMAWRCGELHREEAESLDRLLAEVLGN